ncbi:hypothetical protein PAMP_000705 [Pampus punctatissimus]
MSVRRALVDCAVLSLQDACVFYPCCKSCFVRIDVQQQDTTRCRCSRCGYSCLKAQVDYRYRLSLKVTRDESIFGVTVFGNCLNPFFGIHASGLQRLVENLDGPVESSTRSTLLVKAVKDCFIGRHFIFGIKVAETESRPWLGGRAQNGSSSKDTFQFIANQMILPGATGLEGCSVVSYYRILLQKAAEYEQESTDPSKTYRPPATTLLMIPHHSSVSSWNNVTLSASGLLSQSMQRSQHLDCTLTPTPPWRQSLGLVTSSAEQEEDCSIQDSGDEKSKQTDNKETPHHAQSSCLDEHVKGEKVLSFPLSLDSSSYNSPSFGKYSHSCTEKAVRNTPNLNTWFSPSPPSHKKDLPLSPRMKGYSARTLTKTFLSSSFAWEDFPSSESLSEFVCKENKDFYRVSETDLHLNVKNQRETTRNNLRSRSQDKNLSSRPISVCQSNTYMIESHSLKTLDIANKSAQNNGCDRHYISDQASNICSDECNQENEKAISLFLENDEEEHLEGDVYNCSADLFSSSRVDMNTNMLNTHVETVRTTTEACPLVYRSDKQSMRSERAKGPSSTHDKRDRKSNKCISCNSLTPQDSQDQNRDKTATADLIQCDYSQSLDFIPSSQSTPIVKVAVASGSPASSYSTLCGRESTKENLMCGIKFSRRSHRFTPKRRFWKSDKHKHHLLAIQRGALNMPSGEKTNRKFDSNVCSATVCDYEDNEVIVPPTPAAKTQPDVKTRRRRHTDNSSCNLGCTGEGQQADGFNCKRTLLDQILTSSSRGRAQTGYCVISQPCDAEVLG